MRSCEVGDLVSTVCVTVTYRACARINTVGAEKLRHLQVMLAGHWEIPLGAAVASAYFTMANNGDPRDAELEALRRALAAEARKLQEAELAREEEARKREEEARKREEEARKRQEAEIAREKAELARAEEARKREEAERVLEQNCT